MMTFNRLVGEMLSANFNQSMWHLGVGHFLGSGGLLATDLTRGCDNIYLGVYSKHLRFNFKFISGVTLESL